MKQLILFIAVFGACTSVESTGIDTVSCPTDSTLTYTSFGSSFMTNNCLSCHQTRESPKLGTQAQVQAHAADILQEAVYTTAMPESSDMTIAERQLLGEWIACGAP
jgi:uncharacterized membrane protein